MVCKLPTKNWLAFHQLIIMLHGNVQTNIIWTKKPVYRDFGIGNLDKIKVVETLRTPLQYRFDSDCKACLPVTIHNQATFFAFIQAVISGIVPVIHCTAMGTPFGSAVSVNFVKRNFKKLTIGFQKFPEFSVRDSVNFSVGFFVKLPLFASHILKFFNRYASIIFLSERYNPFSNLAASCFDKIFLFSLQPLKALSCSFGTFISKALQICPSFGIPLLPEGNVLSEVKLPDNFGFYNIKNTDRRQNRRAYVNAKCISSEEFGLFKFFFKNNCNFPIFEKRNVVKNPSAGSKGIEPLKLPVFLNRNCKRLSRRVGNLKTRIISLCFDEFEPSFVKPDRSAGNFVFNFSSFDPNVFPCLLNNVRWQKGGFSYA